MKLLATQFFPFAFFLCLGLPASSVLADPPLPIRTSEKTVRYQLRDFGLLPMCADDIAPDLNESGIVSAWQLDTTDTIHACVWQNALPTSLPGLPNFAQTFAAAISPAGTLVGVARSADDRRWTRATFWKQGKPYDLGTLGGEWSTTRGINATGQIVGSAQTPNGDFHAVLWATASDKPKDLGTLEKGKMSLAQGIKPERGSCWHF